MFNLCKITGIITESFQRASFHRYIRLCAPFCGLSNLFSYRLRGKTYYIVVIYRVWLICDNEVWNSLKVNITSLGFTCRKPLLTIPKQNKKSKKSKNTEQVKVITRPSIKQQNQLSKGKLATIDTHCSEFIQPIGKTSQRDTKSSELVNVTSAAREG